MSVEFSTLIFGTETNASITAIKRTATEMIIANSGLSGDATNHAAGPISAIAKNVPGFGRRDSRYGTAIDYARRVIVDVLISCAPEYLPIYAKPGDAGADLRSTQEVVVPARERVVVGTGVQIALPDGFVALVHPRSGLAAKFGVTVLNTPGTVDAGYRGEIFVTLYNSSDVDFKVSVGDRIAQLVIQEFVKANFISVTDLPGSERGAAGLGSTGRV